MIQNGEKIWDETGVKLACKTVLAQIFTSDEYPMLLEYRQIFKKTHVRNNTKKPADIGFYKERQRNCGAPFFM